MVGTGKIDRKSVRLSTEAELLYWCARLRADQQALREAVQQAGADPRAVERWLAEKRLARIEARPDASTAQR